MSDTYNDIASVTCEHCDESWQNSEMTCIDDSYYCPDCVDTYTDMLSEVRR
ncbi:hypothetical protein LCGC14_2020920 [marine sediment metagenome]|uniref:Uncharacterized protein n=1 Tax=marine sediment metagenome TaxID=412755 RepID=A0A0F9HUP7_9ZZZZ